MAVAGNGGGSPLRCEDDSDLDAITGTPDRPEPAPSARFFSRNYLTQTVHPPALPLGYTDGVP